ncbi:MAG: type I-D CRISPR-associated protein Cas7/Csc2 [Thermoprotei archaeon]
MSVAGLVEDLKQRLVAEPPLLRTPKTVQILLIRQTHDYTVLRTEETRELNVVVTPTSAKNARQMTRVVFLASKQKAPETRQFASIVKNYYQQFKDNSGFKSVYDKALQNFKAKFKEQAVEKLEKSILNCELKDLLCRTCPRCTLFGAVVTNESKLWERWNIKHRIEYSSAFSLESYETVAENLTFNAVTESTQMTGQALGSTENVSPLVNFASIVSLNSPTWEELVLVIKTLLVCKSYGAEGRVKGDVVNYITGLVFGNEEILTPLEYVLELSDRDISDAVKATYDIAKKYGDEAAFPDALRILTPEELRMFVDYVSRFQMTPDFVGKAYADSLNFALRVDAKAKEEEE